MGMTMTAYERTPKGKINLRTEMYWRKHWVLFELIQEVIREQRDIEDFEIEGKELQLTGTEAYEIYNMIRHKLPRNKDDYSEMYHDYSYGDLRRFDRICDKIQAGKKVYIMAAC